MLHVVTTEQGGTRTDVLVATLSGASRSRVAESARLGRIAVNGEAAKPSRIVEAGDVVEFEIPPLTPLTARPEDISLAVVYEDGDVLVVSKPAGMVTHPAPGAKTGTLVNALLAHAGDGLPGERLRAGLVHRLDRDTSGLLLIGKTERSLRRLQEAMARREIAREYVGLVCGLPQHRRGTIEGAIGRDPRNRLKFAVVASGKPAVTHYEVADSFAAHAELVFTLETGRTHQIRVHCAAMGHPLLNDPLYGRRDARVQLPGQALHARRLSFAHPADGRPMQFETPPPPEYAQARRLLAP
ncbi:MAG: RluA family pseudouridine synthase [Candidatus Eremiobacteraeota bacterium]|nr:RluA family pseudouridine synthase [Candidatus Eremiobacteraeota bacterium]